MNDRRLIEDYLPPTGAISKGASQERSVREQCILTLGLWKAQQLPIAARYYSIPAGAIEKTVCAKLDTGTD